MLAAVSRSRLLLAGIVVFAIAVAWLIRFGTDDAYISFVYARNLVRGDGLTWYGDAVEGYTNFLWVLWSAAGIALGADPLVWAWTASLAALGAAVIATYGIVRARGGGEITALCATALVATSYSFLAFGTAGLETMTQTALLAIATWQVERLRRGEIAARRLAVLSVVCALALWTRLDSGVVIVVLGVALAPRLGRDPRRWAVALVPAVILVGGWLAWKLVYYGDVLPNTFHAKVGWSTTALAQGASYVGAFLHAYLIWPILVLAIGAAVARRAFTPRLPAAIVGVWFAYVVAVGGDFMEFRFIVPVLPPLFVLIAELATAELPASLPGPRPRAVVLVAILGSLSLRHAASFDGAADHTIDSVRMLGRFYGRVPDGDWGRLGRPLHDALAGSGASLACNGAGVIPYFADLPTVDQLGLNDRWVAENGARPPASFARPGHQRFATLAYLESRKVTFVIGSPTLVERGELPTLRGDNLKPLVDVWLGAGSVPIRSLTAVAAPIDDRQALLMWYLTPTPAITARIRAAGWEMKELGQ
jgi:hypothetical protein